MRPRAIATTGSWAACAPWRRPRSTSAAAGSTPAALALAAQVFRGSDPAYARRCLMVAERIFDRAQTRRIGTLLTTSPHDYYPEVEWRDDLELGAAELARATAEGGDPNASSNY